jgi:hypothetical protein
VWFLLLVKQLGKQEAPARAMLDVVMPQFGGAATALLLRNRFPTLPIDVPAGEHKKRPIRGYPIRIICGSRPTGLGQVIRKILVASIMCVLIVRMARQPEMGVGMVEAAAEWNFN